MTKQQAVTALAWIAILLAAAVFILRGPLRASSGHANDFSAPYVSGRLWLRHQNPYDPATFLTTFRQAGAPTGPIFANPSTLHSVYPPPSVFVLLPLALLPWPVASAAFTLLTTVAYLAALLLLARFLPGAWRDPFKPVFLAAGLLFAPTQSSLHVSNPSCLSASLLFIAIYLLLGPKLQATPGSRQKTEPVTFNNQLHPYEYKYLSSTADTVFIALLLAVSLCLKPTQAPIILLYLLITRAWRVLLATLAAGALICILSVLPLLQLGSVWLTGLRNNLSFGFTNGTASLLPQNLTRLDRIDLQLPIYLTLQNPTAAILIAAAVTLLLLGLTLRNQLRETTPVSLNNRILWLAAFFAIGLLPAYQRFYSATLLLFAILWALANLRSPIQAHHRISRWLLAISLIFLVNTTVLQRELGVADKIAPHASFLANAFIAPHVSWIVLTIASLLVLAVLKSPSQTPQP